MAIYFILAAGKYLRLLWTPDSGYDPKEYGGATAVVSNNASKEVSGRMSKLHGRWKTDKAKNMYVLETDSNRLSVTKYLGI